MHFAVLVVGDDVHAQLAPFQQNNMGDCPRQYMKFYNADDEYHDDYETCIETRVVMPDGELLSPYDRRFCVSTGEVGTSIRRIPDDLEQREIPVKELYPTIEDYLEDLGFDQDEETGQYGYWENPNAKWDWYGIGGRWRGMLPLKIDNTDLAYVGEPSLIYPISIKDGFCDSAFKRDINFDRIRKDAQEQAIKEYDEFEAALKKHDVLPVAHTRADFEAQKGWDHEQRTEFFNQPLIQALQKEHIFSADPAKEFCLTTGGREAYIKNATDYPFVLYAILKDGVWLDNDSMDDDAWRVQFTQMLNDIPDDVRLTVVDCHM